MAVEFRTPWLISEEVTSLLKQMGLHWLAYSDLGRLGLSWSQGGTESRTRVPPSLNLGHPHPTSCFVLPNYSSVAGDVVLVCQTQVLRALTQTGLQLHYEISWRRVLIAMA